MLLYQFFRVCQKFRFTVSIFIYCPFVSLARVVWVGSSFASNRTLARYNSANLLVIIERAPGRYFLYGSSALFVARVR